MNTNTRKILDALGDLGAPDSMMKRISKQFSRMEIAEEEIAAAMSRHPEKAEEIHDRGFLLCYSNELVDPLPDHVYRSHCQELLDRLGKGEDTTPATYAEMLRALSDTSLKAPLTDTAATVYMRCAAAVGLDAPGVDAERELEILEHGHKAMADETEHTLRRKLGRDRWEDFA